MAETLLMSGWPWLSLIALPMVAAGLLVAWPRAGMAVAPWVPLPALALSFWPVEAVVTVPWLMLGSRFGLDSIGRGFLFFTALLWLTAGLFARAYVPRDGQRRFFAFFLLTMTGNLGLVLAHDAVGYYLFFALMSFAAYGLIVHDRTPEAIRAGRVYIVLVVAGEALLFVGVLLLAVVAGTIDLPLGVGNRGGSPRVVAAIALLLAGFGIKVGAMPLHVWLPLAHPAAPTPASAVLSGAIIKAGLLGWLRFLPLGEAAFPGWGGLCVAAGLLAAYYGAVVGVAQDDPKVVLAYSSISQMGIMTVAVGGALLAPAGWPLLVTALVVYALHHALAKGALFLGVGVAGRVAEGGWRRGLVGAGLVLPALALAGAPLTSGTVAKASMKEGLQAVEAPWSGWLEPLLAGAAVGTSLLMARFLYLVWPRAREDRGQLSVGLWLPWAVVLVGVAVGVWLPWPGFRAAEWGTVTLDAVWSASWPILVGGVLGLAAWRRGRQIGFRISAGDVLGPIVRLMQWVGRASTIHPKAPLPRYGPRLAARVRRSGIRVLVLMVLRRTEVVLLSWAVAGLTFLALLAVLLAALVFPLTKPAMNSGNAW